MEKVAGNVGKGREYGSNLVNAPARYKDIYSSYTAPTSGGHYGDAVYETSSSDSNSTGWYSDRTNFPYSNGPFFERGGIVGSDSEAGLFEFEYSDGDAYDGYSFRVVVPVL